MTTNTTYAQLLEDVSIKVTPNDAAFLAELVRDYLIMNDDQIHEEGQKALGNLIAKLSPKAGC